jgi:hypothetical protein
MGLVITQQGLIEALDLLTEAWGDCSIGLYASEHTPALLDNYTTYALIEASFPGYRRMPLSHWIPATWLGPSNALTIADLVTWTRTAGGPPQSVWGYFVQLPDGTLFFAESDPHAPQEMNNNGDTYRVSPSFELGQCDDV